MASSKKFDDAPEAEKPAPGRQEPATRGRLSKTGAVIFFLLPTFISRPFQRCCRRGKAAEEGRPPINATSYLDGLRGVAALIVYWFHYSYRWYGRFGAGWGSSPEETWFVQLPIVRVLHSGRASVTVFFVISGFVLTVRPLKLLYRGQHDRLVDALGGALFRRPFRLFLPITVSTGIIATLCQLNVFDRLGIPTVADNPRDQLRHFLGTLIDLWNPFRYIDGRRTRYNNPMDGNLWTIPVEFKGSILVFVLLLALLRARCWIRLGAVAVAAVWLIHLVDFDMALFAGGLFFAELSLLLPPASSPGRFTGRILSRFVQGERRRARFSHLARHALTLGSFFASLWLLGYPQNNPQNSPGYRRLSQITPAKYSADEEQKQFFWFGCGSLLLFGALMYSPPFRMPAVRDGPLHHFSGGLRDEEIGSGRATTALLSPQSTPPMRGDGFERAAEPLLQRPFTSRLVQYLGRVSYSLYLAHDSVNHIVCNRLLGRAGAAFGRAEAERDHLMAQGGRAAEAEAVMQAAQWAYWWMFVATTLLNTFVLFWVSDVFARAVDANCVKLARRFQRWAWART